MEREHGVSVPVHSNPTGRWNVCPHSPSFDPTDSFTSDLYILLLSFASSLDPTYLLVSIV